MERHCTATTKAGEPCRAAPLKGREFCITHDPETKFGTPEQAAVAGALGGAAKRKPRVVDVIRERIEEEMEDWLAPLYDAREATRAVVVGTGPKARLETVPDYATRIAAVREFLDRAYGKPRQSTLTAAVSVEDEGELEQELEREVQAYLEARGQNVAAANGDGH